MRPSDRVQSYVSSAEVGSSILRRAVRDLPEDIPRSWTEYIFAIGNTDLLAAWLICAWVRQKIAGKAKKDMPPDSVDERPWPNTYWLKDRAHLAQMQIASANRQTLQWSGEEDVLSLSGSQILTFLFLIQHIWEAWLRDTRQTNNEVLSLPIAPDVQSQGVYEASLEWRTKQSEGPNVRERRTFIDELGQHIYVSLTNDKAMSYPGANGFSIPNSDLEEDPNLYQFLCEAVSYGDLLERDHTSKKKGERRTKYYLTPIFSPYFRIPAVHTKEPEYVRADQVNGWRTDRPKKVVAPPHVQKSLWSESDQ